MQKGIKHSLLQKGTKPELYILTASCKFICQVDMLVYIPLFRRFFKKESQCVSWTLAKRCFVQSILTLLTYSYTDAFKSMDYTVKRFEQAPRRHLHMQVVKLYEELSQAFVQSFGKNAAQPTNP